LPLRPATPRLLPTRLLLLLGCFFSSSSSSFRAAAAAAAAAGGGGAQPTPLFVYGAGSTFRIGDTEWDGLSVSSAERALPAGCACVESGVEAGCKFDCTCECDLVAGQCDPNCCCDADCTALEIAEFGKTHSFCRDTATAVLSVNKCMSTASVLEVNPSYGIRLAESSVADGTAGFLCVVKDNNPTKGEFYSSVITPQSDKVLEANGVAPEFAFRPTPLATLTSTSQLVLVPGDRLQAAFPSDADLSKDGLAAFGGYLPLPTAGLSGHCDLQNYVKFQHPVIDNRCTRKLVVASTGLADACTRGFAHTSLVGDGKELYVLKQYAAAADVTAPVPSTGTSKYVAVEVGTFQKRDAATGQLLDVDPGAVAWNASTSKCSNALLSVHYRVTYTPYDATADASAAESEGDAVDAGSGGVVAKVVANIVVGDLVAADAPSGAKVLSAEQEFLVDFVTGASNLSSTASSAEATRARSGNPGYEVGRPVLSGTLVSNNAQGVQVSKSAIQQTRDGLRMPFFADPSGDCVLATEAYGKVGGGDDPEGEPILFGHDVLRSCVRRGLTSANVKAMCEADPTTLSAGSMSTYGTYMNTTALAGARIGVYGNADYTNTATSEWLELKVSAPSGAGRFSSDQLVCGGGGLVTSMDFEFLVAKSGAYLNPQSKIIAARVVFGTEDVQFVANSKDATATMDLVLTSSVTFVYLGDEALEEYVPPAPPLLPEIPYDIFYPFLLSAGVSSVASGVSFAVLAVAAAVSVSVGVAGQVC
jgi:hypothetical protein